MSKRECPLRARELEIVKAMAEGDSAKTAARKLKTTPNAINMALQIARRIVDVKNTPALIAMSLREGWIK